MNYLKYAIEDFIMDESFQAYYLKKDQKHVNFWQRFKSKHPEKINEIEQAEKILDSLYHNIPELSDKEFGRELNKVNRIFEEDDLDLFDQEEELLARPSKWTLSYGQKVMISFVVLIAFISIAYLLKTSRTFNEAAQPVYMTEKYNPYGQKSSLYLNDGTFVILNSDSKLKFPADFYDSLRSFHLEGQAYFKVARGMNGFEIFTDHLKISGQQTSFAVRAYPEDQEVSIAVEHGRVEVEYHNSKNGISFVLNSQQKGIFDKASQSFSKINLFQQDDLAWKDGHLVFDELNINQLAMRLTRWYGVNVENRNYTDQAVYSGSFQKQSLPEVLETLGITFNQNGQTIFLIKQ